MVLNPDLPNLEELRFGDGSCYGYVDNDDSDDDSYDNSYDGSYDGSDNDMTFENESHHNETFENETPNQEDLLNQPKENENEDSEETNNTLVKTVIFESSCFSYLLCRSPQTSYHLCRV